MRGDITYVPSILIGWNHSHMTWGNIQINIVGLAQDCSNSSALPMELPQSCTRPYIQSLTMYLQFANDGAVLHVALRVEFLVGFFVDRSLDGQTLVIVI